MKNLCLLCMLLCILNSASTFAQTQKSPEITASELRFHDSTLASTTFEGRKIGSTGANLAADYIASEFKLYGLLPLGEKNSFYQRFDYVSAIELGKKNYLNAVEAVVKKKTKKIAFTPDKDYRPFGFSSSGSYQGKIVFAGYGISAPDKNYDDFKGIDIKDKAVLVFRNAPPKDSIHGDLEQYASLRYKAMKVKELGGKVIIYVTNELEPEKDILTRLSYDQASGNAGIMALHITRDACSKLLSGSNLNHSQILEMYNASRAPQSIALATEISLEINLHEVHSDGINVIGYLSGKDSDLKNEAVIVGAHYDHLGFGGEGSGSLKPDTLAIHGGADDNASGTSGLLEMAQFFASKQVKPNRSMVFIAFSGEEAGLLGSGYYVKHPLFPLESSVAMINMDMIGRLRNKSLILMGIGTAAQFDSLVKVHNSDSLFSLKLNKDGFGPSDHSSFYGKKIPVLNFFTDLHEDYHRPSDTYDKLNFYGMQQVVQYASIITNDLASSSSRPTYVAVESPKPTGNTGRSFRVTMGTIPDFGEQTEGMKISGVREGGPAAKAGLQGGDIILKFDKTIIKNLTDFMYGLNEHKAGDIVDVVYVRGKDTTTVKVILDKRN